jgi:NAD dependent epimerase/dehydratase family enzyme
VNFTAPVPLTNTEFTRVLGQVLRRPTHFPVPAVALRLAVGEMADELLLASVRVMPERLQASGYEFRHWELAAVLRHVLGR